MVNDTRFKHGHESANFELVFIKKDIEYKIVVL